MYRETYDVFESYGKSELRDYFDKNYIEDFCYDNLDEWLDDAIEYDLENGYARDFIYDEIKNKDEKDLPKSIAFLKFLLDKPENKDLSVFETWEKEDDRIFEILDNSKKYREHIKENIGDYVEKLDLYDKFWRDMKEDCKDDILEWIDDGISAYRDPYGYNGVSERDFFG